MNANHLPAGQPMPGGGGGPAPAQGGGRRRGPAPPYSVLPVYQQHLQNHPHHVQGNLAYPNTYVNPYAYTHFPPHQMAHHYQTGHMLNSSYTIPSYTTYPQRHTPAVHQTYPPIVSSSMQAHPQVFARPPPQQSSPALSTPPPPPTTAPPPPPPAPVPETPSSTHSAQAVATPLSPTTPQPQATELQATEPQATEPQTIEPPATSQAPEPAHSKSEDSLSRVQYYPVPWLSLPNQPFPSRATKSRRRRRKIGAAVLVELPTSKQTGIGPDEDANPSSSSNPAVTGSSKKAASTLASAAGVVLAAPSAQNPSQEHAQSTKSIPVSPNVVPSTTSMPTKTVKSTTRTTVPAVPVIPAMPKASPKESKSSSGPDGTATAVPSSSHQSDNSPQAPAETAQAGAEPEATLAQPAQPAPKLWSGLFQRPTSAAKPSDDSKAAGSALPVTDALSSGATSLANNPSGPGSFAKSNAFSLAEALRDYQVSNGQKISFLEPRGLVNTGNMCYMNSVLQALVFCTPFYDFLDQVSKKVAHSFKSETPLIDAMVMFLREYKVIDSAVSVDQLRRRLKSEELEQYGDSFIPEFVYDAMKRLPRFATMERGHQQDAEEFLGFLLQALSDECTQVMRHLDESSAATETPAASTGETSPASPSANNEWHEVGRKQRAAITRSSGHSTSPSPISKIFSGQQRSVVRVQGQKDSVTCEPYQPLQLDIGDAHVNNIVDALKQYTRPETLNEDFSSTRPDLKPPTKQVLIESVPPVLILHLKRFKFDPAVNGTIKLWTKIDYPLELELPKEIFSPLKRSALQTEGVESLKYRLTAVIYHHGKSASGGHYTVDIRRQDDREWIRVDDTVINRIRSEDVAKSSLDSSTAKSAAWVDQKQSAASTATGNRFEGIGDEDVGDDEGWNKVTSAGAGAKKWSSVVNTTSPGNTVPAKNKSVKENVKDNKVAYLLFYQNI
ncbi:cysteine proteinase [Nemania sp. NC0429]|nr:cysteine proteinase [Nemania sp. NC0429]